MEKQSLQTLFGLLPSYSSGTLLSEHLWHTTYEEEEEQVTFTMNSYTFLHNVALHCVRMGSIFEHHLAIYRNLKTV